MARYVMTSPAGSAVEVQAPNALAALGHAVAQLSMELPQSVQLGDGEILTHQGKWVVHTEMARGSAILREMSRTLAGVRNLEDAARMVLRAGLRACGCDAGAVLWRQERYLTFLDALGPASEGLAGVRIPITLGVAGHVVSTARPAVVGDVADEPRHFQGIDALTGYDTKTMLAVPIVRGPQVHGVLELMNPSEPFGTEHVRIARELAAVLAGTNLAPAA